MKNISIVGFGRIGRDLFRQSIEENNINIISVSDVADKDNLVYLLKYDSIYGQLKATVTDTPNGISVNGKETIFNDWKDAEKSDIENLANAFAKDIKNKTCVIYGGTGLTELVSSRWKTQINENAKAKAFIGSMPEVHHNEILSWQADEDGTRENFIIIMRIRT